MSESEAPTVARTGHVAIVGRPNVGKSTLLNALVGEHVSITSRKPQTTRQRVLGVLTRGELPATEQFIFVDTPGFQRRHRSLLTKKMNESVTAALADVDAVVLVIESKGWTAQDDEVLRLLPTPGEGARPVVLAINKVDICRKEPLLTLAPSGSANSMTCWPNWRSSCRKASHCSWPTSTPTGRSAFSRPS